MRSNVCKAHASAIPLNPDDIRKVWLIIESKCSTHHFNQVSPQYHTKIGSMWHSHLLKLNNLYRYNRKDINLTHLICLTHVKSLTITECSPTYQDADQFSKHWCILDLDNKMKQVIKLVRTFLPEVAENMRVFQQKGPPTNSTWK